jgi:division protein CdvB (Snf7/Vps24/ESCRT-III family)
MSDFESRWQKQNNEQDLGARIKKAIKTSPPLKPRIEQASRQLQIEIAKLDTNSVKLRQKEDSIFGKVVSSIQKHDNQHASMLANELAEVRKMGKMITSAKLALEQISLRLNTIQDIGDVASMLSPTVGVIKGVRSQLIGIVPEAQNEMGEISDLLSGILSDAGHLNPAPINFESADAEAEKVLTEAEAVAEQQMRERFPDLPISEDTSENREEEESLS